MHMIGYFFFFFSSRRRHTRWTGDWSSDVCSSDLFSMTKYALLAGAALACVSTAAFADQSSGRKDQVRGEQEIPQCTHRIRSEERRVGKECRSRWSADY